MDRVTRLSTLVLKQHEDKFTTDFTENKKILGQLTIIRSKGLKNEVAGYITKYIKRGDSRKTKQEEREADLEEEKQVEEHVEEKQVEEHVEEEQVEQEEEPAESEDSSPQEILVENQNQEPEKAEN